MIAPEIPHDEATRLNTLRSLKILDTESEERFDRLTRLAKRLFGVPIALVSLVDENRQWFKSCQGLDASETPRDISFCGHAILGDDIFVIPDASQDGRFSDNPLVTDAPHIRFYAGCPLKVANGSTLGTLCIIDQEPREFEAEDRELLRDLARMVEQELAAIHLATIDELTSLSNRRGFLTLAGHALNVCRRQRAPASLFFFDLDLFKQINDDYGHAEGDRVLIDFSRILMSTFRESDVVCRLGGDEFAVFLTNTDELDSETCFNRLKLQINAHNQEQQRGYKLCYSVGHVDYDRDKHNSIEDMLKEADDLMYEQKRNKHTHHSMRSSLSAPCQNHRAAGNLLRMTAKPV